MAVRVGVIALVMLLLGPGTASAATLSVLGASLQYTAAPGETNALDVRTQGTTIVFRDSGAAITDLGLASVICTQPDQHTVNCDPGALPMSVQADLGDGDDQGVLDVALFATIHGGDGQDTLTVSTVAPAAFVEALGDAGNDVLVVGAGGAILRGGPGDDQMSASAGSLLAGDAGVDRLTGSGAGDSLQGGPDADVLVAGDGNDQIQGDGGFLGDAADSIDAGSGDDHVQAGGGNDDVSGGVGADNLNGGAGDDRVAGGDQNDVLDGAEGNDVVSGEAGADAVNGGVGDDQLTGGPAGSPTDVDKVDGQDGSDTVTGGPGADALLGGPGDDRVTMGPGRDRTDAGADDDVVIAADAAAGRITCGAGEDTLMPDARDRVKIDCETIELAVSCPRRWRSACTVTGTITTTGRRPAVLGRGSRRVARRAERALRVPLTGRARTIVRRAQRVNVRLNVAYRAGKRRRGPLATRFSLHATLPAVS